MKPPPSLREALQNLERAYEKQSQVLIERARSQLNAALAAMEDKKCPVGIDWCPQGKVEP